MLRRVFVIVVLLFGLFPFAPGADARRPDAPQYAQRGPYAVGTQDVIVPQPDRPLEATIWYPALNPDNADQQAEYRYGVLALDGNALRDAAPDADNGPYPLVVFSHGSGGFRLQSLYLMEHLASYGFVVISADHLGNTLADSLLGGNDVNDITDSYAYRPLDVLAEIDFITGVDSPLVGVVDGQNVAVMGHSFGGNTALAAGGAQMDFGALSDWCADPTYTTLAPSSPEPDALTIRQRVSVHEMVCFLQNRAGEIADLRGLDAPPDGLWPPTTDPRIQAIVALAPWNAPIFGAAGLANVTIPAMIMVGSADSTTYPPRDAYTAYTGLSSATRHLVVFENAEHLLFANACTPLMERAAFDRCSDPVWDMARAHDLIDHMATAFLLATFYGDAGAAASLQPDAVDFTGVIYLASEAAAPPG
ncbi:alpha/beta hydrolase family protein [Aggregatilinea lenta]|uniref:alpha/beta hydrolase family protein n=1 Tax=Aggregatilinea lenta TaxID=913108 RepID=UPI000E5AFFE9|nr:alpha/beta fold hydrolase [Aggregatilinea lenta]